MSLWLAYACCLAKLKCVLESSKRYSAIALILLYPVATSSQISISISAYASFPDLILTPHRDVIPSQNPDLSSTAHLRPYRALSPVQYTKGVLDLLATDWDDDRTVICNLLSVSTVCACVGEKKGETESVSQVASAS